MSALYNYPFMPINSSSPGFSSTLGSSGAYALEATGREFKYPSNRLVRVAEYSGNDYSITLGTSDGICSTETGVPMLGGTVEVFPVYPKHTHIFFASSTSIVMKVALGHGGF